MSLASSADSRIDPGLLGVRAADSGDWELAAEWAKELGVALIDKRPQDSGVVLLAGHPAALELINPTHTPKPVVIDFTQPQCRQRLSSIAMRRDPLVKAIGLHRQRDLTVIDATAGLGHDGLSLAWLGAQVKWLESSPTLALVLRQAITIARSSDAQHLCATAHRLSLTPGRAELMLPHLEAPEVVYLDPMYPPASLRGAAGKEAQTLRALVGEADHASEQLLLEQARASARRRVVSKRPHRAPPLANHQPRRRIAGKSIRFDIYE